MDASEAKITYALNRTIQINVELIMDVSGANSQN